MYIGLDVAAELSATLARLESVSTADETLSNDSVDETSQGGPGHNRASARVSATSRPREEWVPVKTQGSAVIHH